MYLNLGTGLLYSEDDPPIALLVEGGCPSLAIEYRFGLRSTSCQSFALVAGMDRLESAR